MPSFDRIFTEIEAAEPESAWLEVRRAHLDPLSSAGLEAAQGPQARRPDRGVDPAR